MRDAWRLATGTLTAVPVAAPSRVDAAVARRCVLVAPLAVWPLALAVTSIGALAHLLGLPPLVAAVLALGALALGTRVLHWDGLSDTVDGLTASYDRERSLAVMKSGTSGPAGVLACIVVAGLQSAAMAELFATLPGAVLAGAAVLVSRAALSLTCRAGVSPARRDGLGHPLAGVVPTALTALLWGTLTLLLCLLLTVLGRDWWTGLAAGGVAVGSVLLLVRHCTRRLGGVTGDVYGAGVEIALATLLVTLCL